MAIAKPALDYYSFDKLLSYNAVYNFVVGARGYGKTYGAKKIVIRNYLRDRSQFVYLRRYQEEIKGKFSFFSDIAQEFPDVAFRINGNEAQVCRDPSVGEKNMKWETMGFFVVLANAQSKKGVSYHHVKTVIYDEFIIEKGFLRYLPNEAKVFNDFYSTVDRWKDKTRVLFLANALTIMNPYFHEYDIAPKRDQEFIKRCDGFVIAQFPKSQKFIDGVFKTRFGKFIEGTEYAEYSVVNEFHDNNDMMLAAKPSDAIYRYSLDSEHGTVSVWSVASDPTTWYVQSKRPKKEILFTLVPEHVGKGMVYLGYSNKVLQHLRAAYARGYVFFDTASSRNAFTEVFVR